MGKKYLSILIVGVFSSLAHAADTQLDEVVVSVNKTEQKVFDTAASVSVINRSQIQDSQLMVSMSESAAQIPGLYALNRQNYAQDVMISSRGFGSNSAFGARAVKIYVDGIPATIADGQGQTSHIDLASADRIEVLRGPFSSMYGNSAGGVIQVFTERGQPGIEVTPYASYGSFGTTKYGVKVGGDSGQINYLIDANRFDTDGSRDHSAADRNTTNAKLAIQLGSDSQLTIIGNSFKTTAQDPLGLSLSAINSNSQAAGYNASAWNSRKSVEQNQGGLEFLKKIDSNSQFKLSGYYGQRTQDQYQAPSPTTTLYSGIYKGGEISLDRSFYGYDLQYQSNFSIAKGAKFVLGLAYDKNTDKSTSSCNQLGVIVNCPSSPTSLYTNAAFNAQNFDQYMQTQVYLTDQLTFDAGIRHADVTLGASNNQAYSSSSSSPDNWTSGARTYSAILPMSSLSYLITATTNIYLSVGRGSDTPTLNQIKYGCTANCAAISYAPVFLEASTTNQYELGIKQKIPGVGNFSAALFEADTNKEIVVAKNIAGKSAYTNADKTKRQGFELFANVALPSNFGATLSYTYLLAKVDSAYYPYTTGPVISAGSFIPGIPKQKIFGDLFWRKPNQSVDLGIEVLSVSGMTADDANNFSADGYTILNLRASFRQKISGWTVSEFIRVNNLTDKYYVGSVIVNQSSGYYFEPAPGRNWIIGAKANYKF